jgi:thioredoxin reductase
VEVRLRAEVTELHGETALEAVGVNQGGASTVESADGLMLAVGLRPRSGLVRGSLELDADDAIAVASDLSTSAEGVFAAGDLRAGAAYAYPDAVDDGLRAAAGVLRWLELPAAIHG